MLQFQKVSFKKYLIEEIKNQSNAFFSNLILCPSWLNVNDYHNLTKNDSTISINKKYYELDNFVSFAKYLGAKEDNFNTMLSKVNSSKISNLGCVQFSLQIFKSLLSRSIDFDSSISNLRVIICNNERVSLGQVKNDEMIIDQSFLTLLIENGLTKFDIKQVLMNYISDSYSNKSFPELNQEPDFQDEEDYSDSEAHWFNRTQQKSFSPTKGNIKRWRSAEEQTLEILNLNGFKLEDVSKQNIGYDLEGFDPNGNDIQIEVKSITLPGQKFKLTNNEIAVAQEKKDTYYLAIIRQLHDFIEIALISDPANSLTLNRQCVQWIWECSSYDYKPTKFEI